MDFDKGTVLLLLTFILCSLNTGSLAYMFPFGFGAAVRLVHFTPTSILLLLLLVVEDIRISKI
jgi:hypothetical protein